MSRLNSRALMTMTLVGYLVLLTGCGDEAKKAVDSAAQQASDLKDQSKDALSDLEQKAKDTVGNLSEEASSFLGPIKEQLAGLSGLKDKPAELKTAVEGLLAALSSKAAGIALPEGIQTIIATLTEKIGSLKTLLGSENPDAAQIDDQLKQIDEAAKGL